MVLLRSGSAWSFLKWRFGIKLWNCSSLTRGWLEVDETREVTCEITLFPNGLQETGRPLATWVLDARLSEQNDLCCPLTAPL